MPADPRSFDHWRRGKPAEGLRAKTSPLGFDYYRRNRPYEWLIPLGVQTVTTSVAAETDAALTATAARRVTTGIATETDAPLAAQVRTRTGYAAESDTGLAATSAHRKATTIPAETDAAIPLFGGPTERGTTASTANTAFMTVTTTGVIEAGALMLLLFGNSGNVTVTGISGGGVTWVDAVEAQQATSTRINAWYAIPSGQVAAGTVLTISFSGPILRSWAKLYEVDGVDPAPLVGTKTATAASGTNAASGAFTPASGEAIIFQAACWNADETTFTPASGWSALTAAPFGSGGASPREGTIQYRVAPHRESNNPANTVDVSAAWAALTVAFRAPARVTTIPTGVAGETDGALPAGHQRRYTTSLAAEADTALAAGHARVVTTSVAAEADTALAATHAKLYQTGLAEESDGPLPAGNARVVTTGLAHETDEALPSLIAQHIQTGVAEETDEALPCTVVLVPPVVPPAAEGGGGSEVVIQTYPRGKIHRQTRVALETDTALRTGVRRQPSQEQTDEEELMLALLV